jgi:hypothetical protein
MHGCKKAFSLVRSSADPGAYDQLTVCLGFDGGAVEVAQAVSSAVTKTKLMRLHVCELAVSMTSLRCAAGLDSILHHLPRLLLIMVKSLACSAPNRGGVANNLLRLVDNTRLGISGEAAKER